MRPRSPENAMRVPGISCIGARIYLGKVSSLQVDAGRFVDWGIVKPLESAGLATVDAVERGTELDFGVRPNVVAGGAQPLEYLLAGGGILRQRGTGRSYKSNSRMTHVLIIIIFSLALRCSYSQQCRLCAIGDRTPLSLIHLPRQHVEASTRSEILS
jgi:hypothetical protein